MFGYFCSAFYLSHSAKKRAAEPTNSPELQIPKFHETEVTSWTGESRKERAKRERKGEGGKGREWLKGRTALSRLDGPVLLFPLWVNSWFQGNRSISYVQAKPLLLQSQHLAYIRRHLWPPALDPLQSFGVVVVKRTGSEYCCLCYVDTKVRWWFMIYESTVTCVLHDKNYSFTQF